MSPGAIIYLIWGLWFIAWLVAAVMSPREAGTLQGPLSFVFHLIVTVSILFLLAIVRPFQATDLRYGLWDAGVPDTLGWVLVTGTLVGFGFFVWASVHRTLCLKHGASLVDSGPYAVVRHPLYLSVIIAAAVTAVLFGQLTSVIGAVLLATALIAKVIVEEHATGDAAHCDYRRRVPMFVPFWPMPDHAPRNTGGRLAK